MLYTYAWWGLWTTCSNQELIGDFNSPEKNSLGAIIPKCSWKSEKHMKPSTRQVWKSKICYWFILQLKNEDKHFATKKKGDVVHQQNSVPSQEMLVENFKKQLLGLNIKLWYSDPKKKIEFREIRPKSGENWTFSIFLVPKKKSSNEKRRISSNIGAGSSCVHRHWLCRFCVKIGPKISWRIMSFPTDVQSGLPSGKAIENGHRNSGFTQL